MLPAPSLTVCPVWEGGHGSPRPVGTCSWPPAPPWGLQRPGAAVTPRALLCARSDLEKSVEKIQKDLAHNHRLIPVQELEEKAVVLKQLGETLTDLKGEEGAGCWGGGGCCQPPLVLLRGSRSG